MIEKPTIKEISRRDKHLPQNFEQLIEMYDIEKIWPYILKIIEFANEEFPEKLKALTEEYQLEEMLSFFLKAKKTISFDADGTAYYKGQQILEYEVVDEW